MDSASNFLSNLFMISVMFLFLEAASFPRKSDPFRSLLFDPPLIGIKTVQLYEPTTTICVLLLFGLGDSNY